MSQASGSQSDPPSRWPLASVTVIVILAWIALSWPWLSGIVTIPWDAKAHFQPQLQFLAEAWHSGRSPFWTPYVFSGSPQVADPQSLIFSPPFALIAAIEPVPGFRLAHRIRSSLWLDGAIAACAAAKATSSGSLPSIRGASTKIGQCTRYRE